MAIADRNTARKRLLHFIKWQEALGSQVTGSSTVLDGFGTGSPVVSEVSNFGYGGFELEVGDMLAFLDFETLSKADVSDTIGVRVRWIEDVASPIATDAVTFVVLYDQADLGESMVEPATALDTPIAAHVPGETTGLRLRRTSRGIISASKFDAAAKNGVMGWRVEADAVTSYTAGEIMFLALEIDYMPHFYRSASEGEDVHAAAGNSES